METRRTADGHLLVRARVGPNPPGWFLLDSGSATHVLSASLCADYGLRPEREVRHRGVGGGGRRGTIWGGRSLRVGPLSITHPTFLAMDLSFLSRNLGVRVQGILGAPLFELAIVDYDQGGARVLLHDPAHWEAPSGLRWERVVMHGGTPHVLARFEGRIAQFNLDTGAASDTVTFHSPTVTKLDLLSGRRTHGRVLGGALGPVRVERGSLRSFEFGGQEFGAVEAGFATSDEGALSDPWAAGNIGGRLLEGYTVYFDLPHRRIALSETPASPLR